MPCSCINEFLKTLPLLESLQRLHGLQRLTVDSRRVQAALEVDEERRHGLLLKRPRILFGMAWGR